MKNNHITILFHHLNQVNGDWKENWSKSTYNFAIVFGTDLDPDQTTAEYASRSKNFGRVFKEYQIRIIIFWMHV